MGKKSETPTAPKTVMVKHLLHTYWEEVDHPSSPGVKALRERLGNLGEEIEVTRQQDLDRGYALDAYYTDEEAKAIKDGTYRGPDAASVYAARGGQQATPIVQDIEGEGTDVSSMSVEDIAALINPEEFGQEGKKLNVDETIALVGESPDVDTINKVLDAEIMATDNDPRSGVQNALEAKLTAASQG